MSFDGIFLHHMTRELAGELMGGRIQRVTQPFALEMVLTVRSAGRSRKLLLSAHPRFARLQLTETDFVNPMQASTFTMMLRKYLAGAVIERFEQVGNDRVLWMHCSTKDELGDDLALALVIELMGKHSNIILVDKNSSQIIESIKHIGPSQNQYRTILPGATYIAPPSADQADPFTASDARLFESLQTGALQRDFQGIGRDSAQALSSLTVPEFRARLATVVPSYYPSRDSFSSMALSSEAVRYDSLSALLEHYYRDKAERDRVKQVAASVIRRVDTELKKNREKLLKQERELAATDKAEGDRQKGELLNTYLAQVPNNQPSVTLENYYTNQPLTIALNVALSPAQNAQRYFHRYQKLKQAVKILERQIAHTQATIAYLESVATNLAIADVTEIADIREELIQTGFIRRSKAKRAKNQKMLPPERYQAPDGTVILVGKNNLQNEEVSFKRARRGDTWLHVKDMPGSHVLITGNPAPSDETLTFAGELAAYFSKGRHSNLVQVDVLEAKKLHKPTGTPPGFVTYNREKTIRVTPDEAVIAARKIK